MTKVGRGYSVSVYGVSDFGYDFFFGLAIVIGKSTFIWEGFLTVAASFSADIFIGWVDSSGNE